MTDALIIALAQVNPTVGHVRGNVDRLREARGQAAARGADLVIFPELAVSGYPPEDLVVKPAFLDMVESTVRNFAGETADGGPAVLVGAPWRVDGHCYNAALLLDGGDIAGVRLKVDLPNYGVFDEKRVFAAGPAPEPLLFRGVRLGVQICEDMWGSGPTASLAAAGAEILVVLNGSPFEDGKFHQREALAAARALEAGAPLIYVNQVGGQDELVFDGTSFVVDAEGAVLARAPGFREHLLLTQWRRSAGVQESGKTGGGVWHGQGEVAPLPERLGAIYQAMVLGLRDYVQKNRFPGVLLGLSGGIDSAISAAVAVDALGAGRVHSVMMPSPFTSQESLDDAAEAADLLGCRYDVVSIEAAMDAVSSMLFPVFSGTEPGITEENIQSRLRGLTLMALSNKFGAMVLSTGNKSEMSVGYATLYGDMCGGYSVLKDVFKTMVFDLCHWRNTHQPDDVHGPMGRVVPERVITKPPSAELRPNQTDQDSLPPYPLLDAILEGLVERDLGVDDLEAEGYDRETVLRVWHLLDGAEYKRRQAPPGVKLTSRSFGRDRRYPLTNRFRTLL